MEGRFGPNIEASMVSLMNAEPQSETEYETDSVLKETNAKDMFLLSVYLNHMHKSGGLKTEDEARLILLLSNLRRTEEALNIDSFHG